MSDIFFIQCNVCVNCFCGASDQYSRFESKNELTCLSSDKNHLNTLMPGTSVCTTEYCNIYQFKQNIACHNLSALHVNTVEFA